MNRTLWLTTILGLLGIIAFSFARPHLMVSPGNLIAPHAALEENCFACHAPLRGASSQRCMACHKLADIGLRTTGGRAIARRDRGPAFHQALREPNCMACHSDHPGPAMARTQPVRFDHAMLRPDVAGRCQSCHVAPKDELHRSQPAQCATCHQPPRWKPATFDHSRFFALDRHHNTTCTTCHTGADYRRYTCYGCHEHQPAGIIAEHREEGITNIENCVRCHRSARGEPEDETAGERDGGGGDD